jgi:hypothetical protein
MAKPGPVNETELLAAVLAFQKSGSDRDAQTVLRLADPLIIGMVARSATAYNFDYGDAYVRTQWKLWKALRSYNPISGRVFSYFNTVVQNHTRSLCNEHLQHHKRWIAFTDLRAEDESENLAEASADPWRTEWQMEEIRHRLCTLKTSCVRENELRAQRWLVRGLISTEFSIPRHEAIRALRIAFDVDLKTARLIHDRTMLELRRTMLAGRRDYPAINIARFRDKRATGLIKFKLYLSQTNFNKLCFLMKDLAPQILSDLIDKEVRALNGDGTPERRREIIRKQLNHAICGYPDSRPLFSE